MKDFSTSREFGPAEKIFYQSLVHDEGMIAVLRGHLYIEATLHDVLRARLGDDADVVVRDLDFQKKYVLARRLKLLSKAQVRALQALGEVRNSFAHTLERSLSPADDEKIFNTLDEPSKAWIRDYLQVHPDENVAGAFVRLGILMIHADIRSQATVLTKYREQRRAVVNVYAGKP